MLGHRFWKLVHPKDGPKLMSLTQPVTWEGPVFHADKAPGLNPVPGAAGSPEGSIYPDALFRHKENHHGIYTLRNRKQMEAQLRRSWNMQFRHSHYVVGSVEMWGKVVEHENGWRAEHCIIRELHFEVACPCTIQGIRTIVQQLEARYDCPVTVGPLVEQLELQAKGLTPEEWYEKTRDRTVEDEWHQMEHAVFGGLGIGGLGKGVLWGIGSPVFKVEWAARSILMPAPLVVPVVQSPLVHRNVLAVFGKAGLKGLITNLSLDKLAKLFKKQK